MTEGLGENRNAGLKISKLNFKRLVRTYDFSDRVHNNRSYQKECIGWQPL